MNSTRRTFVRAAIGGGALTLLGAPPDVLGAARKLKLARDAKFLQGVASGEPAPKAITLWTRLEGLTKPALTRLEVARDAHFKHVVHTRAARRLQRARLDRARPRDRPEAGRGVPLPLRHAGRALGRRALPHDRSARLARARADRLLLLPGVHRRLLPRARGPGEAGRRPRHLPRRLHLREGVRDRRCGPDDSVPVDGEAQTLAEYRAKYSLYHTDPHLLEVRRNFPLVAIWDDHEVEDNYAGTLPGGGRDGPADPVRRAPRQRLPRVLRAHAAPASTRPTARTARCRWATPSCSCSTRASSAATSRATRATRSSPSRARRRPRTTRRARCSARRRRRG